MTGLTGRVEKLREAGANSNAYIKSRSQKNAG